MPVYTKDFYKLNQDTSRQSARETVPFILKLVGAKRVIDIGCGVGTWLSVFREYGVKEIFGVDGEWVEQEMLEIPRDRFLPFDLKKPLRLEQHFDLVLSLEIAEHLPGECAETFIDSLTRLGPVIVFSAAIPFQRGMHHINEQWPDYWVKFFQDKNFVAIDCLRKKIWQNDNVQWYYAQNILLFVRQDYLDHSPHLQEELEQNSANQLCIVHPKKYLAEIEWMRKLLLVTHDLALLIPGKDNFVLVDQETFRTELPFGSRAIPFPERDGQYWGLPADDAAAMNELERLRHLGATFIVFGWPAFWWLDYYSELRRHLRSEFPCLLDNDRLVMFDLRPGMRAVR